MSTILFLLVYGAGAFFLGYSDNPIVELNSVIAITIGGAMVGRFIGRRA